MALVRKEINMGDIFGTCATAISLIQSAYDIYDGYEDNKTLLKELE